MKSKQTWQIMHIQITYKQSKITYTLQPPKDSHLLYHFNSSSENSRHMTSKGHGHKIFLHTRRHFIWSKQIWSLEMPQANLRLEIEYLRILQFQSFLHPIFSYINEITVQQSISMIRCSAERTQTVMIKKAMASENLKRTACELGRRMKPQRWQLDSQFGLELSIKCEASDRGSQDATVHCWVNLCHRNHTQPVDAQDLSALRCRMQAYGVFTQSTSRWWPQLRTILDALYYHQMSILGRASGSSESFQSMPTKGYCPVDWWICLLNGNAGNSARYTSTYSTT